MKTTGLTIQEAILALREGIAGAAKSPTGHIFTFTEKPIFMIPDVLGTWSLIDPVITPMPGEVWRNGTFEYFTIDFDRGVTFMNNKGEPANGADSAIHNQNGWTRVYYPKEAKND